MKASEPSLKGEGDTLLSCTRYYAEAEYVDPARKASESKPEAQVERCFHVQGIPRKRNTLI